MTREQLIFRVTLLLGPDRDDLRLRMHASADRLRALACQVDVVASVGDCGGNAFVLSRNRLEVVNLVEDVLERLRLEDHLDERRVARLVDVDHPQVELA